MTEKILLDTDIGSDIDDAVALAYLLGQPDCDLLGITTVTGQAVRRAMLASALCHVANQPDMPIYPGADAPLLNAAMQTEAPQARALARWSHRSDFPTGEAVAFMRQTIRQHPGQVTLLAIGPLTNIALLFSVDPEIPALLKQLVLMAGWYMDARPHRKPEWNVRNDPHAASVVFRARPPVLRAVGLDVTMQVMMDADEVRRRFDVPLLRPVLDMAEVGYFTDLNRTITFHDPLAAVTIFEDDVCAFEAGRVVIAPDGTREQWQPGAPEGWHQVATRVHVDRFFERYFATVGVGLG